MAGSVMTFTYDDGDDGLSPRPSVRAVICTWTSDDTTGAASATTDRKIVGELLKVVTDPGSAAPTDNWDVVITDENGLDPTLQCENVTALAARDTANTEETYLYLKNTDATALGISTYPVVCGALTVAVANAGNSKTGVIKIYYRR